ncbi:MAG: hypothetical protein QE279_01950 [Rhodoferax sp.]|nr:hypothetical protein [Rhodoferax sp.]
MKLFLLLMAWLACLAYAEPATEVRQWEITIDGDEEAPRKYAYKPFSNIDKEYAQKINEICWWNIADDYKNKSISENIQAQYTKKFLKIRNIGTWGKWNVIDVSNANINHKGILLQDKNKKYYILYLQFDEAISVDFLPFIANVQGREILIADVELSGTAREHTENYFVLDSLGNPAKIDLSAIRKAINKAVPTGWGVWKGGIDIRDPAYSSPVWKRNDANCCPTGGEITIHFSLVGAALQVNRVHYDQHRKQ